MEIDKISICICVYQKDNPDHFLLALRSISSQTRQPDEIVLIVDGPINDTIDHSIHTFEAECPYFNVYKLAKNSGHAAARQEGLKRCKYNWVGFMDADDIARQDRLQKQIDYINQHPNTDVLGGQISEFIHCTENVVGKRIVPTDSTGINQYLRSRCPMNMQTILLRKDKALSVGGFIDWYCEEDYYLWIRLVQQGATLCNLPDILADVRVGTEMYNRRGGWKYFSSERSLQLWMLKHNMISIPRYTWNVLIRFIVQILMPNHVRSWVFQHFFRNTEK